MNGLKSRSAVIGFGGLLIILFLAYAFWPRAIRVDIGEAERGSMAVTIDEEAKTRVRESYVVSAPVAGQLLRVDVEPGDVVAGASTVVARMAPANPSILDVRTEEQAKAAVDAAEAALVLARAKVEEARADADYAETELARARTLRKDDIVSQAAVDRAERASRATKAALETARATVAMRAAELENARAMLMAPPAAANAGESDPASHADSIPLRAPVSGRILRVMQESEAVIPAGTPILEIGDPSGDLEIVAELLSTDAVKASAGDRVIIEKWGGDAPLSGVVERIEPWGFTKISALGVEEQRVNAVIQFTDPPGARAQMGHGFRVNVRIVVWEKQDALSVPSSAVFRKGDGWAVFRVVGGRARETQIRAGATNGVKTEILSGLEDGDAIVLYPSQSIVDGARVSRRSLDG